MIGEDQEIFDGQSYRVNAYDANAADLLVPNCKRDRIDFFDKFF